MPSVSRFDALRGYQIIRVERMFSDEDVYLFSIRQSSFFLLNVILNNHTENAYDVLN